MLWRGQWSVLWRRLLLKWILSQEESTWGQYMDKHFLLLLPLLLGDAAPDASALEKAAEEAGKLDALLGALIALGSRALAEKALASGAEKPDALSGGAYSPVICALGLALEERS